MLFLSLSLSLYLFVSPNLNLCPTKEQLKDNGGEEDMCNQVKCFGFSLVFLYLRQWLHVQFPATSMAVGLDGISFQVSDGGGDGFQLVFKRGEDIYVGPLILFIYLKNR